MDENKVLWELGIAIGMLSSEFEDPENYKDIQARALAHVKEAVLAYTKERDKNSPRDAAGPKPCG